MKLFTSFYLFAVIGTLQSVESQPHLLKSSSSDLYQAVQTIPELSKEEKDRKNLLMLMAGEWITRGIYAAAKLDVASMLDEGPKTIHELALRTRTDKDSLERLLRLLTSVGLFKEMDFVFSHTSLSRLLSSQHPSSLRNIILFYGEDMHQVWDHLVESLKVGLPAFSLKFGQPVFTYFNENSERAEVFNQAMKQKSKAVIDSTLQAYPFEKISTIYDIGGGQGHFLAALFKSNPQIKGVLFDLPEVIATLTNSSLKLDSSRCEFITGDFFTAIPTGGDAYVLKSIIHDWNDEQALQILKNCNQAMAETSRLLLIEVVLRPSNEADYARCMDLLMLAVTGGKERSRDSFEKLLDQAGFEIEAVYPTTTEFSVIEAKKRQCLPICPERSFEN